MTTRKNRYDTKTILEKHEHYKGSLALSDSTYIPILVLIILMVPFGIIGAMYLISYTICNGVTIWDGTVVTSGFPFISSIASLIVLGLLLIVCAIIAILSLIEAFKAYFWEKKYDELLRRN